MSHFRYGLFSIQLPFFMTHLLSLLYPDATLMTNKLCLLLDVPSAAKLVRVVRLLQRGAISWCCEYSRPQFRLRNDYQCVHNL
jgi:hypothetical protein